MFICDDLTFIFSCRSDQRVKDTHVHSSQFVGIAFPLFIICLCACSFSLSSLCCRIVFSKTQRAQFKFVMCSLTPAALCVEEMRCVPRSLSVDFLQFNLNSFLVMIQPRLPGWGCGCSWRCYWPPLPA